MREDPLMKNNMLGLRGPINPIEREKITLDFATPENLKEYKTIRLEAIENDPGAYDIYTPEKKDEVTRKIENYSEEDMVSPVRFTVISRYDSEPIGIVGARKYDADEWVIYNVYVRPKFRKSFTGNSVAEDMMKKALGEIKKRGGRTIVLNVENSRQHAIDLYKSLGFRESRQIKERFNKLLKRDHGLMEMNI